MGNKIFPWYCRCYHTKLLHVIVKIHAFCVLIKKNYDNSIDGTYNTLKLSSLEGLNFINTKKMAAVLSWHYFPVNAVVV